MLVDRTNPRNKLSIGSDVEIAKKLAELLSDKLGQIVFTEGQFWFYKKTAWEPITTTTGSLWTGEVSSGETALHESAPSMRRGGSVLGLAAFP